jgi:hypothetical protein
MRHGRCGALLRCAACGSLIRCAGCSTFVRCTCCGTLARHACGGFGRVLGAALLIGLALGGCAVEGDVLSSGDDDGTVDPGGGDPPEAADCAAPPDCTGAGGDLACGRLHDVETSRTITAADGPLPRVLALGVDELASFDPTERFADATAPDACGRYLVPLPATGDLLIATLPQPGDGTFLPAITRRTAVALGGDDDAFALRAATDTRWSSALGASPVDRGALLLVFVDVLGAAVVPLPGAPVADVRVTVDGLSGDPDIAYFADAGATTRAEPSTTRTTTAQPGAALVTPVASLAAYGGTRGTTTPCGFGAAQGTDAAGLLLIDVIPGACAP